MPGGRDHRQGGLSESALGEYSRQNLTEGCARSQLAGDSGGGTGGRTRRARRQNTAGSSFAFNGRRPHGDYFLGVILTRPGNPLTLFSAGPSAHALRPPQQ